MEHDLSDLPSPAEAGFAKAGKRFPLSHIVLMDGPKRGRAMPLIHDAETWQTRLAALPLKSYGAGQTVFTEGSKTGQLSFSKAVRSASSRAAPRSRRWRNPARSSASFPRSWISRTPRMCAPWSPRSFTSPTPLHCWRKICCAPLRGDDPGAARNSANRALLDLKSELHAGRPAGLIDNAIGRIQGLLGAIGDGYLRAGAGVSMFPPS